MKKLCIAIAAVSTVGCATLTSDAMTPIAMSFGDGSSGKCELTNKRGAWSAELPTTVSVRRSDDALQYQCKTVDGREASGSIASTVGAKIVASAVFIDLGITDAITDKHREYAASFVVPIEARGGNAEGNGSSAGLAVTDGDSESKGIYAKLNELDELRKKGILTDAEFESEKKKVLEAE